MATSSSNRAMYADFAARKAAAAAPSVSLAGGNLGPVNTSVTNFGRTAPTRPAAPTPRQDAASTARYSKPYPVAQQTGKNTNTVKGSGGTPSKSSGSGITRGGLVSAKSGGSSSSSNKKVSATPVVAAAAPVKPFDIDEWLATDETYQGEKAGLDTNWADFLSNNTFGVKSAGDDYQNAYRKLFGYAPKVDLGVDELGNALTVEGSGDPNVMGGAYKDAMDALNEDFGARGMYGSGAFLTDQNKTDQSYQQQKADLDSSQTRFVADAMREREAQRKAYDLALKNARNSGSARYASNKL